MDCGATTCITDDDNNNYNNNIDIDTVNDDETEIINNIAGECGSKASCRDCLNDETSTCGWVNEIGCLDSCYMITDVSCYDIQNFNNDYDTNNNNDNPLMMTGNDICVVAENDMADTDLCYSQTDCTTCIVTALVSDASKTCQWFQDGNYCSSGCGMQGCGESTCSADANVIKSNGSDDVVAMSDDVVAIEETSSAGGTDEGNDIQQQQPDTTNDNDADGEVTSSAMFNEIQLFWAANFVLLCFL